MNNTPDGLEALKYAVLVILVLLACTAFIWLASEVVARSF